MKRVNFVSLDFLTLQWFCNTLQTQHPQTQAAKELYDALEALYAGKSDSLMLELGEAIPEAASTSLVCGNLLIDSKSRRGPESWRGVYKRADLSGGLGGGILYCGQ